ncbi:transposase DNA-binding-containing protein [Rheinheimera texasensis]|jgi:hypothetical protein|uniref:IS4/Tn5 family transposase DNA-binding protein n=1 Tax=Rheinheimera texasensis TaxID=306205 RepID=UPI0032B1C8C8
MITSALHRAADWAKSVFSSAALGDPRRTARLVNVAAQLAKYSGKSITISSEGSEALQEGAYRFIRNPNVYLDKGKRKRKEKAGSLQWAYMAIARLGGFMDSKRTGIASWGALWEGWEALQSKLDGFLAAKDLMAQGIKI